MKQTLDGIDQRQKKVKRVGLTRAVTVYYSQ